VLQLRLLLPVGVDVVMLALRLPQRRPPVAVVGVTRERQLRLQQLRVVVGVERGDLRARLAQLPSVISGKRAVPVVAPSALTASIR
jgi:hypothetical protein